MNARLILIQTLVPWLARIAQSPDKDLASAAAQELAAKTKELAQIKRHLANHSTEGAGDAGVAA